MKKYRRKEKVNEYPLRAINKNIPISVSIGKIFASWFLNKEEALGTGFFIKIKKEGNNNLYQYFFVTCEHVIPNKEFEKGYQNIEIAYHLETAHLSIDLDKSERFIKEYITSYKADITIIELKNKEIPAQYFLEPDYNVKEDNYAQYIGKEIIIHQFPKGRELCFSEGNITGINKKKREMSYKVSTEDSSSGSPIIDKDTNLVIGVHKLGNEYENCANFFDVVLSDNEREKSVPYIREYISNKKIVNYTKQGVLDIKTKDKREYHDQTKKYKVILIRVFNDIYNLRIINTYTNTEYNKQLDSKGEDLFEIFDLNFYNFIIVEGEYLELIVDFKNHYYLPRKEEDKEFESEFSFFSLSENKFYNKPIKESKKFPQINIMMNKFQNLSLNNNDDELKNYPHKHYDEFKKFHSRLHKVIKNIDYERSFESKDSNSKDNNSNNTQTYTDKKNDEICNVW